MISAPAAIRLDQSCTSCPIRASISAIPANAAIAAGAVAGITALDLRCAKGLDAEQVPVVEWDYSDRSGFPGGTAQMRGSVEAEFAAARAEPNGYSPSLH